MSENFVLPHLNKVFFNGRICKEVSFKETAKGELAVIRMAINKFAYGKKYSVYFDLYKWDPPEGLKKYLIVGMPLQVEAILANDNNEKLILKASFISPMRKVEDNEVREQVDVDKFNQDKFNQDGGIEDVEDQE